MPINDLYEREIARSRSLFKVVSLFGIDLPGGDEDRLPSASSSRHVRFEALGQIAAEVLACRTNQGESFSFQVSDRAIHPRVIAPPHRNEAWVGIAEEVTGAVLEDFRVKLSREPIEDLLIERVRHAPPARILASSALRSLPRLKRR